MSTAARNREVPVRAASGAVGRAVDLTGPALAARGSALSLAVGAGVLVTAVLTMLAWSISQWSVATSFAGAAFAGGVGLLVASGASGGPPAVVHADR